MINLVRGEMLKARTTNAWWLFGLGALGMLTLAFLWNALFAHAAFHGDLGDDDPTIQAQSSTVFQAANLFTSGQYFGLLFVMLLGIVMITNEFHHQTATTTFLTTPHRTLVVLAKLTTAALFGAGYWLITTALNIPATIIFLNTEHVPNHLGEWPITRAILLNLLAYVLWGILGVGFGVLIRSQIGATVTAVVLYLIGTTAASIIFTVVSNWLDRDWIEELQVIVPSIASSLMVSGTELPGNPPQWSGAAVLIGYALVTGVVGTLIIRTRDIS